MTLFSTLYHARILLLALGCVACAQTQRPVANRVPQPSLVGEWIIVTQSVAPLQIATLCQAIRPGAIITFSSDTLAVYTATGKPCAVVKYKVNGRFLSFSQQDMVWLATYELTTEHLTIRSPNFFAPAATMPAGPASEIQITLTRK